MRTRLLAISSVLLIGGLSLPASAKRPYTLRDEVQFADFWLDNAAISYSPDGKLLAVNVRRGLLKESRIESELRIYSADALRALVSGASANRLSPSSLWTIKLATSKAGPSIDGIKWTANSQAIVFLQKTTAGVKRLMLADVANKTLSSLSDDGQDVTGFTVADRAHFAYAVRAVRDGGRGASDQPSEVLTGRSLTDVVIPESLDHSIDRNTIWAATNGTARAVLDPASGKPLVVFDEGVRALAMSPDGRWILTALPLSVVPDDWRERYPSPTSARSNPIPAGRQNVDSLFGHSLTSRYALIDTRTNGTLFPLNTPTGRSAGWWPDASPMWSADGSAVLLPGVFQPNADLGTSAAPPCIGVFLISSRATRCVEPLAKTYSKGGSMVPGAEFISAIKFDDSAGSSITITAKDIRTAEVRNRHYVSKAGGAWAMTATEPRRDTMASFSVSVDQSAIQPPRLLVTNTANGVSRVVWDPNPEIADITFSKPQVFEWTDSAGRQQSGGLFLPQDYRPGKRYPLVIQTHGFSSELFRPSGGYTTGYAAQVLAASGIIVLETRCRDAETVTPREAACQVDAYESAVKALAAKGMIDPEEIGIIGFSRTCYYVMEALTKSSVRFKAASITDGVNEGYWQYIMSAGLLNDSGISAEADAMIGAKPFGVGLQTWLKNSPTFNTDRISAAVQVVGEGKLSLMFMWEPYALLRFQNKPVDLILLNTDEHLLTNPTVRMASQGGSVDWFRFWLQGYEDPDPAKAEQYRRWRELRQMQEASSAAAAR